MVQQHRHRRGPQGVPCVTTTATSGHGITRAGWRSVLFTWSLSCAVLGGFHPGPAAAQAPAPLPADSNRKELGPELVATGTAPLYKLVYKLTPGQFVHYHVAQKTTFSTQFAQEKQRVQNESQAWRQFRVLSVTEQGEYVLEPLVQRVRMQARFDETDPIIYDSAETTDVPFQFREVAQTVGRPVGRLTVKPTGELVKVALLDGAPSQLAAVAAESDSRLNFLVLMPAQEVGIGGAWRDKFHVPVDVGGGLKQKVLMQRDYTLSRVTDNIATITIKVSVLTPMTNPQVEAQLIQRRPNGVVEFDLNRGLVVRQTANATGDVIVPLGTQNALIQGTSESVEKLLAEPPAIQPAALRSATVPQ